MRTAITKKKPKNTSTQFRQFPALLKTVMKAVMTLDIEEEAQKKFTAKSPEQKMAVIPHHLRSKAAGANSLKKGARDTSSWFVHSEGAFFMYSVGFQQ